jgi:galactokinase
VPGRVELVGKHVDYAGGRSMTCAVGLSIRVRATSTREPMVCVRDSQRRGLVVVPLSTRAERAGPMWSTYVAAVARRFARDFPHAQVGVDVRLRSELPASAGLSSSSALVVALGMALVDANEMDLDPRWQEAVPTELARAEYFAAIESGTPFGAFPGEPGVGVRGGAQDHVAIMCGAAGMCSVFSYLPARLEQRVAWPAEYVLAIGVSGVRATKTGNARGQYNLASDAMRALVGAWNAETGRTDATLAGALGSDDDAAARLAVLAERGIAGFAPEYLAPRLAQYRAEVEEIVPGVAEAMGRGDWAALGALVDRSQQLAETGIGNQVPETVLLQRSARALGAVAASAFGAGFGGAVWAMVRRDDATVFGQEWMARYRAAFPERAGDARVVVTEPSAAARQVPSE